MTILSLPEYEQERSVAGLISWTEEVYRRFAADPEGCRKWRVHGGHGSANSEGRLIKRFIEEALPLCCFCATKFGLDSKRRCRLFNGGAYRDAQLFDWPSNGLNNVEITWAREGHEDYLRMEYLNRAGSAPGAGPVHHDKQTGEIVCEPMAEDLGMVMGRVVKLAVAGIDTKLQKRGKADPCFDALLVAVGDELLKDSYFEDVVGEVNRRVSQSGPPPVPVVLVGLSKQRVGEITRAGVRISLDAAYTCKFGPP